MGFNDATTGYQRVVGGLGGLNVEFHYIGVSNEISTDVTIPTTLTHTTLGWLGTACFSQGCVSISPNKAVHVVTVCAGGWLGVSVSDVTTGVDDENSTMNLIVWGW